MNQFRIQQEMPESDSILGEIFAREFETDSGQQNYYHFDANWWRTDGSRESLYETERPMWLTSSEASRLYDTMCVMFQNTTSGRGDGRLITRCLQYFPVTSRWVPCKNVVGFR